MCNNNSLKYNDNNLLNEVKSLYYFFVIVCY